MNIRRNIRLFTAYGALTGAFIATPVIVLFWQANGLSYTEIMFLQAFFSIIVIISEVPTGAISDYFSRKWSLVAAAFGSVIGISVYAMAHNFYQFLLAEMILGVSMTCATGADSAFLYDTLKEAKKEKLFKKYYGRAISWSLISAAVATAIGGFIGKIDLRLTLFIQIPIFLLAGIVALFFVEPKCMTQGKEENYFELIKESTALLLKSKEIRWLVVFGGLVLSAGTLALWFFQPYMKTAGLDIAYFGIAFMLFNIVSALSARYSHRIEKLLGKSFSIFAVGTLIVVGFLLFGYVSWIFGFIFGFLFQIARGFSKTVLDDYLNRLVSSEKRATILSFQALVGRLFFAAAGPLAGFLADRYSLATALKLSGFSFLVLFLPVIFLVQKYDSDERRKNLGSTQIA